VKCQKYYVLHGKWIYRSGNKNKCWIDSDLLQNPNAFLPCQFLLSKLSLVRITFLSKKQRKTLIFRGTLTRQMSCGTLELLLTRKEYIAWPKKITLLYKPHKNWLLPSNKLMWAILATRLCHSFSLFPINDLLKDTLTAALVNFVATVAYLFLTILWRFG